LQLRPTGGGGRAGGAGPAHSPRLQQGEWLHRGLPLCRRGDVLGVPARADRPAVPARNQGQAVAGVIFPPRRRGNMLTDRRLVRWLARGLAVLVLGLLLSGPLLAEGRVVLEVVGYVVPAQVVVVSPKVAGSVLELSIEEGQQIKQGEVIGRLDPTEYA